MRKYLAIIAGVCVLVSCTSKVRKSTLADRDFTIDIRHRTTPVKDQGHSQACWLYSFLSMLESEHIAMGDSVNLSARFILLRNGGDKERGMLTRAYRLLFSHGTVPYDACNDNAEHTPKVARMLGCDYTPRQFAGSVCREGEYAFLTSFCRFPYGEKVVLDVPDNIDRDSFLNVPLDSLMYIMERTIRSGHTFAWEGDTSNDDFCPDDGIAYLDSTFTVTEQIRQQQFDSGETADNHCLHIMGMAHNRRGEMFYIAKNSWGKRGHYKGYMMINANYLRLRTIAISVARDVVEGVKEVQKVQGIQKNIKI